ncbi:MAG TPA: tetratricopeptide repeat protein [Longimicrobiaceae bacterium]|nr:tetratricopeptide repeat protein [Longimicrobiaceae bacterium]
MPRPHLQRARLLMERGRYPLAAAELRRALLDEPEDPLLHAHLALCLVEDPAQREEAFRVALGATLHDPLQPLAWYAVSCVEIRRGNGASAEQAARVALSLTPEAPALLAHLAGLLLATGRPREALETAERGLALAPDDVGCLLAAGNALSRLGRHERAAGALARALARDPEDASIHARTGWALLRRGDDAGALRHFREALRLDPTRDGERRGMMEALKARHPVYRALLRASLRLPWLSWQLKWVGVVGGIILVLMLLLAGVPRWIMVPLEVALAVGVVLTWTASSLFDLLLFGDPLGRHALSRTQRAGAVATGVTLMAAGVAGGTALVAGDGDLGFAAAVLALYTIPIAATLRARPGRVRAALLAYTLLLAVPVALAFDLLRRDAEGAARWFGFAIGGIAFSDLLSDLLSGRH